MFKIIKAKLQKRSDTNKAALELQAIDMVRAELANAVKRGANSIELSEIHNRLMSLYAALDIHNVVSIVQLVDFKRVA